MRKIVPLLLFMAAPAYAQVYKCTEGGKTVFSDYPCQRTDNKTIDVRPAAGGPVNRSSEYWEKQKARETLEREREQAAMERENAAYARERTAFYEARERRLAALDPLPNLECKPTGKELTDLRSMDQALRRFDNTKQIAVSTARIALATPLLRLSELREDVMSLKFDSPCIRILHQNADMYTNTVISYFTRFSANRGEDPQDVKDMERYMTNYARGRMMFKPLGTP